MGKYRRLKDDVRSCVGCGGSKIFFVIGKMSAILIFPSKLLIPKKRNKSKFYEHKSYIRRITAKT